MRGPKRLTPFGKMVVKALADRDMSQAEWRPQWAQAQYRLHHRRNTLG